MIACTNCTNFCCFSDFFLPALFIHASPPHLTRPGRCGISQFMQSVSSAAPLSELSPSSLCLPAAAASAFVSEISVSDFVSCGSSIGGGSVFSAITDIDVKVAALNACVFSLILAQSIYVAYLPNQAIFASHFSDVRPAAHWILLSLTPVPFTDFCGSF